MSTLVKAHTTVNNHKSELIRQLYLNFDNIPEDFFPTLGSEIVNVQWILDKYKVKSFADVLHLGEDIKILWIINYISGDHLKLVQYGQDLRKLVQDIYDNIREQSTLDQNCMYLQGGIDVYKLYTNTGTFQIGDLEICRDRSALEPVFEPFTLQQYIAFCWGWADTETPVPAVLPYSAIWTDAYNYIQEGQQYSRAIYPTVTTVDFLTNFPRDVEKFNSAGAIRNYDPRIDYGIIFENFKITNLLADLDYTSVLATLNQIGTTLNVLLVEIANPYNLRRVLWLYIAAIIFGWAPIEQWFMDFNIWNNTPTNYRGPLPRFNEYITKVFNGSPYHPVGRGTTVGTKPSKPRRGRKAKSTTSATK